MEIERKWLTLAWPEGLKAAAVIRMEQGTSPPGPPCASAWRSGENRSAASCASKGRPDRTDWPGRD